MYCIQHYSLFWFFFTVCLIG
uniref:Uncharacterized protein n=1 Tax=Rhizophora mucronata TaxID=61149 RepID=A0A2P2IUD4_RHIMU